MGAPIGGNRMIDERWTPKRIYEGGTGPLADSIIAAAGTSNGFVLEIGIHTGDGSTAMIQEGLENHANPLHISVDWEEHSQLKRPTVPWWHLVKGDSRDSGTQAQVMAIANRYPGMIFIDTDHNYDQMKAELALWGRIATDQTVWLFHDTWMYGPPNVEMVRAITEYAEANNWTYEDYRQDSHGLGRMRRP